MLDSSKPQDVETRNLPSRVCNKKQGPDSHQGPASSNNVRVVHQVPEGFEFETADKGGQYDPNTRTVTWFVGHLDADQADTVQLQLLAKAPGAFSHVAAVVSEHGGSAGLTALPGAGSQLQITFAP